MSVPFGVRVRELRLQRGWTQEMLAEYSEVPRVVIARLETLERRRVAADTLRKLARVFGMTMDALAEGTSLSESDTDTTKFPLPCV